MEFRTELQTGTFPFKISRQDTVLSIGSCFADMVGDRFLKYKFNVLSNPFGNIYNPVSVHKILNPNTDLNTQLFENQGLWYSYDLHSEITDQSEMALKEKINHNKRELDNFLKSNKVLIITYGTAWIYELIENGEIVANCHKQPSSKFKKRLLSLNEIEDSFDEFYKSLTNKELQIIFTVSPVRHIKDTIPLNNVSKSILRLACHQLSLKYGNVHYFPSFELMVDDLRDYRFYKKDMIHPNEIAEEYIWQKFVSSLIDLQTRDFFKTWDEILEAVSHKPFQPASKSHQLFLVSQIQKIEKLRGSVDIENELQHFKDQLV